MSDEWRRLAREAGLHVAGGSIDIAFSDRRHQMVHVEQTDAEVVRLWSVVAKPAALNVLPAPQLDAWHRNRLTELVGFSIDTRGRMIGETWVPTAGLTADEWRFYAQNLARTCDRFEYLLTGRDEA